MSIVVFAESSEGKYKKSTLEAVSFARELASKTAGPVVAVSLGQVSDNAILGKYGADEILNITGSNTGNFNAEIFSSLFAEACRNKNATIVVISNTYSGKSIAPRVSVLLGAALATNVVAMPKLDNGFHVRRSVFSGKAFAWVNLTTPVKVLAITPNSFETKEQAAAGQVSDSGINSANAHSDVVIDAVSKVSGKIPLTEAEIVISGGRGMKGPENWAMIEELAAVLGAATACSKPVADMDWRPHGEHVGQTGITIKPNLYIAIGISGAIQHLAGVSSSKVIVAINKDPEAPFFKAADYGIVGDAFEIIPQLIEAAKAIKS